MSLSLSKLLRKLRKRMSIEVGSETGIEEELSTNERYLITRKEKREKKLKLPIIGIKLTWRF